MLIVFIIITDNICGYEQFVEKWDHPYIVILSPRVIFINKMYMYNTSIVTRLSNCFTI